MSGRAQGTWFITGTSSGFGLALTQAVLKRGGRVAAASRTPASLEPLVAAAQGRLLPLRHDAGDSGAAPKAVAAAQAALGPIDVLVNNAGYGLIGAVEEISDAELRGLMDVNFFGPAALARAVLPTMRERGRGAIVNVSSISGVVGPPGSGAYAASKFAIEGLSESLRREGRELGLQVMTVEPGPFRTGFFGEARRFAATRIAAYSAVGQRRDAAHQEFGSQVGDPVRGAALILEALEADRPPERLVLGALAVDTIRAALARRLTELERWAERSASADYPQP